VNPERLKANQIAKQGLSFQCKQPKNYQEVQEHRAALAAGIIKRFIKPEPDVVDAGCGYKLLKKHFNHYTGVDLMYGHDIEQYIPNGDVVVFMSVLEHVTDLKKTLDNVNADYCYVSVPQEKFRMPSNDHVRRVTHKTIKEFKPDWELEGIWMWTLRPRFWRLRYFFPIVSVFAEDEVMLWRVK